MPREPARLPDRRAVTLWRLQIAAGWSAALALQVILIIGLPWPARLLPTGLTTVSLLLAVPHVVLVPPWRYRVHRWDADEEQVVSRSGWVVQQTRLAPVGRIQTVDTRRGPLARLLGLTTVRITTASSAGAITIVGLAVEDAECFVDRLGTLIDVVDGDAT